MFTVAVDVMGGDLGPRVAFRACATVLQNHPDLRLILPLETSLHIDAQKALSRFSDRVLIKPCQSHIDMADKPARALRQGLSSSMGVAIQAHASGDAQGVLSVGNTGALMILSKRLLGTLGGIDRPALATQIPTRKQPLLMMDLGANLEMSPKQLAQLGLLAISWYRARGIMKPSIALLNIGKESNKGPEDIREAGKLLHRAAPECYAGFAEGDDVFTGDLHALICNGFAGNIALKTTEGLADWLTTMMADELSNSKSLRWLIPLWRHTIKRIEKRISPARHGGAMLLGVCGHVAKTHGKSDEKTIKYALEYLVKQTKTADQARLQSEFDRLQRGLNSPE